MQQTQADVMTEFSERYKVMPLAESIQQQGATNLPHRKALMAELEKQSFQSVLEIGCSVGAMIGTIQRRFHVQCEGFDFNEEAIEHAQTLYPGVKFSVLDATDIMDVYKPESFDVILTCGVLMHTGPKLYRKICKDIVALKPSLIYHVEIQGKEQLVGKADTKEHFLRSHDYVGHYKKMGLTDIRQESVGKSQRVIYPRGDMSLVTIRGAN